MNDSDARPGMCAAYGCPLFCDCQSSRARAHLPRIDLHALGLSLMTDEQAFASNERFGQVQRMYANLVMAGDRT